ncbi:MAG: DUF3455 domain-containing protein [Xanthobacteraceae bacterium]
MSKLCIDGGVCLAAALSALAVGIGTACAQVPQTVAAPGQIAFATYQAQGAQVYECKAAGDGKLGWAFREPIATLIFEGKTVGRHYAGPTWEQIDGSAVTAKAVANAPGKNTSDIPLLKLEVNGHRGGQGVLSGATIVQRLNTVGGVHTGACDRAGMLHSAAYSAEYVFLKSP